MIDTIICGDAIEVMPGMSPKSIPLIIADPPYNIGKAAWDKIDNYLDWCGQWLKACERVLADNGSMYVFHNNKEFIADLMIWIRQNTSCIFKNEIVWKKISPEFRNYGFVQQRLSNGTMRNYYDGFTEYILFYTFQGTEFCIDHQRQYLVNEWERSRLSIAELQTLCGYTGNNPYHWFALTLNDGGKSQWQMPTKEAYIKLQTTGFFQKPHEELRMEYEELRYTFNTTHVLSDVYGNSNTWQYEPVRNPVHPTQKPVDLIENIIKHSSNEGDLVCDPFMGSGSTAVAAIKTGRHYIGIEKDESYCKIARERIKAELAQPYML